MKKTITKNGVKVSLKAVLGISAGLAVAIILMLLSASGTPYFVSVKPPPNGWCAFNGGFVDTIDTRYGSVTWCVDQPRSLLFCLDNGFNSENDCDCLNYGAIPMPFLSDFQENRNSYIDRLNDGVLENTETFSETFVANTIYKSDYRLKCMCSIHAADVAGIPANATTMVGFEPLFGTWANDPGREKKGAFEFKRKLWKFWSKMDAMQEDCNWRLPPSCKILNIYRPNDRPDSPHKKGMAMDICCDDGVDRHTSSTCNNVILNQACQTFSDSDQGFIVRRECTAAERASPNNTTGCNSGLLHIAITGVSASGGCK